MTNLECKVSSCAHYQQGCCSLPAIQVRGQDANAGSQTCCSSYREKAGTAPTGHACGSAKRSLQIHCDAQRCQYNSCGACSADSVCVGNCSVGCASNEAETECCTFRCK